MSFCGIHFNQFKLICIYIRIVSIYSLFILIQSTYHYNVSTTEIISTYSYSLLQNVTEKGEWEPWILFILEAIEDTSRGVVAKIRAISGLLDYTCDYVRNHLPRIYSRELVEMVFTQPYCRIANLVDAGIARRQTASSYLKDLADIGVLREFKIGREKLFLHPKFLNLLTGDTNSFTQYPQAE